MRVLVLTTETTPHQPCLQQSATGQIVATLTRGNVDHTLVHPTRLLQELSLGSQVALLVVDACSVEGWLPEVFAELRRRVLGPSRPVVVVFGDDTPPPVQAPALFACGVSNWLSSSRESSLLDYWHWVCCQSNAELEGQEASYRLRLLEEQCAERCGFFEMADRRLRARVTVSDGWLSCAEIGEFDSAFTRGVRQFIAESFGSRKRRVTGAARRHGPAIDDGHWGEVLVHDALEQQLQGLLRWFMGTGAHTRFVEARVSVPSELRWRAQDLVAEGPRSRYRFAQGFLSHQLAMVANDTALADLH